MSGPIDVRDFGLGRLVPLVLATAAAPPAGHTGRANPAGSGSDPCVVGHDDPAGPAAVLGGGGPQVVLVDLHSTQLDTSVFLPWLSREERERLAGFRHPEVARRFLLTRVLLRDMMGTHLGLAPAAIPIALSAAGKPYLATTGDPAPPARTVAGGQSLAFSLSHSGSYAALAFWWREPLGVDIQMPEGKVAMDSIIRRFFLPEEYQDWLRLAENERSSGFYRAWVRKESYLKATGEGIAGIGAVRVSFEPDGHTGIRTADPSTEAFPDWQTFSLAPPGFPFLAVTWRGESAPPAVFTWDFHSSPGASQNAFFSLV